MVLALHLGQVSESFFSVFSYDLTACWVNKKRYLTGVYEWASNLRLQRSNNSCCLSNDIFSKKPPDVFLPLKRTDCCCASCAGSSTTSQWRPSEKWRTFNPSSEKKVSPHAIWLNLQRPASAFRCFCYWGRMLGQCFSSIFG